MLLVWGPERTRDIRTVPVSIGGEAAAEAERIEPGVTPSSADAASPAVPRSPAPAASSQTPQISSEEEKAMLERALAILQNGDIAAARLLFQRLADKGSARGALAMAKTYDPEVLTGMNVFGLEPDPKTAAQWYARAAEMGNEQARERLATLNASAAR
jgi:TPR repeat protein